MSEKPLQDMLRESSLHTLLIVISRGLSRAGFGDVQILDRRDNGQKSRFGGHEILCQTRVGLLDATVVIKVINDDIRLRMMDEMAGTIIRRNADFGVIISPRNLTLAAKKVQDAYCACCHIEVFDGQDLCALLTQYQIGVRESGDVDYAFFAELEELGTKLRDFMKANKS